MQLPPCSLVKDFGKTFFFLFLLEVFWDGRGVKRSVFVNLLSRVFFLCVVALVSDWVFVLVAPLKVSVFLLSDR